MSRSVRFILPLVIVALHAPLALPAQSWRAINRYGYGMAGGALGLAATAGAECQGGFVCIPMETVMGTLAGVIVGGIVGNAAGRAADEAVAEGRPLGGGHLAAISLGTVVAGASVGGSLALVSQSVGDSHVVPLAAIGAATGAFVLWNRWDELRGSSVRLTPTFSGTRGPGLAARIPL